MEESGGGEENNGKKRTRWRDRIKRDMKQMDLKEKVAKVKQLATAYKTS